MAETRQRGRARGKAPAEPQHNGQEPESREAALEEQVRDLAERIEELQARHENDALREEARKVKEQHKYRGELSAELLDELQPLLETPIPARYISTVEAWSQEYTTRSGEKKPWPPFTMTGVTNPQVQIDRMNAVLGRTHWRSLPHHTEAGQLCHIWVVVGNNLVAAELDERGQLVPGEADILVVVDGWGSYNRGGDRGNHYKSSETSAIKRPLARIGPGHEVYLEETDTELNPDRMEAPPPAADTPAPEVVPIEKEIAALLEGDDDPLVPKRKELDDLMKALGVDTAERLRVLMGAQDERELDKLIKRAKDSGAGQEEAGQEEPEQPTLEGGSGA